MAGGCIRRCGSIGGGVIVMAGFKGFGDVDDRNGQGLLQDRGDQACEQTGEQAGNQNAIRHGRSRTALNALPECRDRHN